MMRKTFFAIAAGISLLAAGTALSQTPADKARVDAAKSIGVVGEQGDGYLGFVTSGADASLTASVTAINTGRASGYAQTAAKTGVTAEAAGQAAARQLYDRMPAGQWFKPIGGNWTRKD